MENLNINYTLAKEIIVGISAIVGMALGIYNLVHSIRKDKVKIKIIPKAIMRETRNTTTGERGIILADNDFASFHPFFAFEIINQSNFSVVVDEIGLKIRGKKARLSIPIPQLGDKGEWPRELKPRNSVVVYGKLENIIDAAKNNKIVSAYVKTACNNISYGKSKALELLKEFAKKNV